MNEVNNVGKVTILCLIVGAVLTFLKEIHVIEWSWFWVTFPFWGPLAAFFLLLVFLVVLRLIIKGLEWLSKAVSKL